MKPWLALTLIGMAIVLAYLGLGALFPAGFLLAVTVIGGAGIVCMALHGSPTTWGTYEVRAHHLVAVLIIWGALGLLWVGYYLRHGAWPQI